jgi:hypothetical protein
MGRCRYVGYLLELDHWEQCPTKLVSPHPNRDLDVERIDGPYRKGVNLLEQIGEDEIGLTLVIELVHLNQHSVGPNTAVTQPVLDGLGQLIVLKTTLEVMQVAGATVPMNGMVVVLNRELCRYHFF